MVHIGFSVMKAANKGKDAKADPPETSTPPLTPTDSPPNHVTIRKRLESDGDEQIIHPTDSLVSELTYPQTLGCAQASQPQQQLRDPPGVQHDKYRLDVALRKFNDSYGTDLRTAFDPPEVERPRSSMGESIVTRVLGIVDIGCVSPFADSPALPPPTVTSDHVEWGLAPSATLADDDTIQLYAKNATNQIDSNLKDMSNPTNQEEVVVCVSQDENQQEHLQFVLPPTSPGRVSSRGVVSPSGKDRKAGWIKSKFSSKRSRKEEARPHQKVEAVLGIMPLANPHDRNSNFIPSPVLSSPIRKGMSFQNLEGGSIAIHEEKKDDDESLLYEVNKELQSDSSEIQNRRTRSPTKTRAKTPTRHSLSDRVIKTRSKSEHSRIDPAIEPTEHRPHQKELHRQVGSSTTQILRKALAPSSKGSNTDDANVMQKLKEGVRLAFQQKKKKDTDRRASERVLPESSTSNDKKALKFQVKETTNEKLLTKIEDQVQEITETKVVTTNIDNGSEQRLRKVLKSIKSTSNGLLETVEETAEDEVSCGSTSASELRVRIPGIHDGAPDAYISDKDLIGDEFVEEEIVSNQKYSRNQYDDNNFVPAQYDDNKYAIVSTSKPAALGDELMGSETDERTNGINLLGLSKTFVTGNMKNDVVVENKTPVVEKRDRLFGRDRSLSPVHAKQMKSWKDYLGLSLPDIQATFVEAKNNSTPKLMIVNDINSKSQFSNPSSSADPKSESPKVHKPMWKPVYDPNSGRTYYYHRETRETTWAKPPDKDLIPAKTKNVTKPAEALNLSTEYQKVTKATDPFAGKKCPPDCSPVVWKKRQDIARILTEMVEPPTPESVEQLVQQYAGREDELKAQLVDLSGSKPFDEPITPDDEKLSDNRKILALACVPGSGASIALSRTMASVQSGFSGNMSASTRISEKTQQIRNTTTGNPYFTSVEKDILRTSSEISSKNDIPTPRRRYLEQTSAPIPKNIPVPRTRELKVEEFTTRDPVFGVKESDIHERKARVFSRRQRQQPKAEPKPELHAISYFNNDAVAYVGDIEDTEPDRDTGSYEATDSVSALSEADFSFVTRQESLEMTRRRALHDALVKKDWERAADISEAMRLERRANGPRVSQVGDWSKDPLDQFLANDDWDAVFTHIAQKRALDTKAQHQLKNGPKTRGTSQKYVGAPLRCTSKSGNPGTSDRFYHLKGDGNNHRTSKTKFGADSILQHSGDEGASLSSYSTYNSYSSYTSEYTSGSYFSADEEPTLVPTVRRISKEKFRC